MGIENVTSVQYTCDRCGFVTYNDPRVRSRGFAELDMKVDFTSMGSVGKVWLCGYCAEAFEMFMANEEKVYRQD